MRSCLFARPRVLRFTCALRATLAAAVTLLAGACGEGLPDVPIDLANHDRCETSIPPYVVDASASEIQCLVEDYTYFNTADATHGISEMGANVPGPPACCEVCAREDTADDACKSVCKYELCERAQDEHYAVAEDLGTCVGSACGFDFETCMNTHRLHVQQIDLLEEDDFGDPTYGLRTQCRASATDPARPDGLFRYLEGLGTIPGAGGGLANVEDVVGYCQDHQSSVTGGESPSSTSLAGDTTGADSGTGGDPSEPPPLPPPCGPYAEERFWVRPTNNFGTWNGDSTGLGGDGTASYPVAVTNGGIAYTLLPCRAAGDAQCLRIDQLSVRMLHSDSGIVVSLGLVEPSGLVPMYEGGTINVPAGALRFAVRYGPSGRETLVMASNGDEVRGRVDARDGLLYMTGITASSEDGSVLATMSLYADLVNTQPATEIVQGAGATWNRMSLTAKTFDAESDPIQHQWVIPRVGTWRGDHIEIELPPGRHIVVLRADDVHRARSIAAQWIDIGPKGR